jgi:ABC-type transporter Mla MlaB component
MAPRRVIVCDLRSLEAFDLRTVELLARWALAARRLGYEPRFTHPPAQLRALIALAGLERALGVESQRQAEEGEEPLRVEEESELDEPPA